MDDSFTQMVKQVLATELSADNAEALLVKTDSLLNALQTMSQEAPLSKQDEEYSFHLRCLEIDALSKIGQEGAAIYRLSELIENFELEPITIAVWQAKIFLNGQKYDEAIDILHEACSHNPEHVESHYLLAYALLHSDTDEGPTLASDILQLQLIDAPLKSIMSLLELLIPALIQTLELERAMVFLDAFIERQPEEGRLYLLRAKVYRLLGDMDSALINYKTGLILQGKLEFDFETGAIKVLDPEYAKALEAFKKAQKSKKASKAKGPKTTPKGTKASSKTTSKEKAKPSQAKKPVTKAKPAATTKSSSAKQEGTKTKAVIQKKSTAKSTAKPVAKSAAKPSQAKAASKPKAQVKPKLKPEPKPKKPKS